MVKRVSVHNVVCLVNVLHLCRLEEVIEGRGNMQ